jgi:hypothetical protein
MNVYPTESAVKRVVTLVCVLSLGVGGSSQAGPADERVGASAQDPGAPRLFRAGAAAIDVGPATFPVLVNGGFLPNRASRTTEPVHAKCIVLDDGSTRIAIVIVDSCMMPRELLDRAKEMAREKTGIATERMLISATHTHSAPAAMGALGCPADESFAAALPGRIAASIERAARNLEPARIGWCAIDDPAHTFCRRWIRRPDKMLDDPFGLRTVRGNMHPGYENPDVIGPSGPVDPALTVLSVCSRAGGPIAVLANYSMHYYGAEPVSADYFGKFATTLATQIGAGSVSPPFVGIMSQGTSGDQMWMDYGGPRKDPGLEVYAAEVARAAHKAYQTITYHDWVPLAMAETTLVLRRRVPDPARLAWARPIVARMRDKDSNKEVVPRNLPEVYAKEALHLHEEPERALKLQALRIGGLGVTAIPNEVFAITGLKIKLQSPFDVTMNVELANGAEGYIPPPEQHALGGYTTWPARTAGLEVQAERRIVARVLELLERVAGQPRRKLRVLHGPYARAVLASRPVSYWRLEDIEGSTALDSTANARSAHYDGGVALYLPGADSAGLSAGTVTNRAVHFAGGFLKAILEGIGDTYSIELWFWNGLPAGVRPITGHLLSFGPGAASKRPGDTVGIGGTSHSSGRLFFSNEAASAGIPAGRTEIAPRTWHHLALARERRRVTVYLDGNADPEIAVEIGVSPADPSGVNPADPSGANPAGPSKALFIAGRFDGLAGFEGKIDEVALYDRALTAAEVVEHVRAASAR